MSKTRTILGALALGTALAAIPAALPTSPTTWAQSDEATSSEAPWAWLGTTEGAWATDEGAAAEIAKARTWVADLRVRAQTGQVPVHWEDQLDVFQVYATSVRKIANQDALAVEVALARSEVLYSLGSVQESLRATSQLLLSPKHSMIAADPARFAPAPARIIEAAAAWGKDPQLVSQQAKLRRVLTPDDDELGDLEATLRANIDAQNFQLVEEIGARAVPVLEAAVLADMNGFPDHVAQDPLLYLMRIAERRAAMMLLEHAPQAGYPLRQRILRAMNERRILQHDDYWGDRPAFDQPVACLTPEWTSVLALLIRDPDSAREAMSRVWVVIEHDGLTAEMSASLIAAFDSGNPDLVHDVLQMLGRIKDRKYSVKGLLEHLLGNEDPGVRRFAADKLLVFRENTALVARFADPDPAVREAAARSLEERYISGIGNVRPTIDESERKIIDLLLQDGDDGVRSLAVRALLDLDTPADSETYLRLLQDENPAIRRQLVWLTHPDEEFMSDTLLALARDPETSVLYEVDTRLENSENWSRPGPLLEAARARLLDTTHPMGDPELVIRNMVGHEEGLMVLVNCARRFPDESLLRLFLGFAGYFASSTGNNNDALLAADDADLAGLFVALHRNHASGFRGLNSSISRGKVPRWSAMLLVLADKSVPVDARLQAALHVAQGGGERFAAAFLDLLSDPVWQEREPSEVELETVYRTVEQVPSRELNAFIMQLMRTSTVPDAIAEVVADFYASEDPLGREITLAVLERWFRADGTTYQPVSQAVFHLRTLPDDVNPEMLMQAIRNPTYARAAIGTMGALRDERYLPALESALAADWIYEESARFRVQVAAISALSGFMSDEAAEVLLRGMSMATSSNVRDSCRSALATLRTNEEERQRWLEHKEGRLQREDAIQRVLVLLRDEDAAIRAEAARALGTLGAVETLPILIEMLRDGNDEVKQAVRAALERLNEPRAD